MDAPDDRQAAISRYREGPSLLERAVIGLRSDELDFAPPGGGWTIRQIVHHIVDGDDIWKLCIKMAIGNEQAEFDLGWYGALTQRTWADRWAYNRRSIDVSLSLFKAIREHILQLLESGPDTWSHAVVVRTKDGQVERVPIGYIIQMQADHVLHHVECIQRILKGRGAA
jgi:hypothetical protein